MERSVVNTSDAPQAIGPYSQAIRSGDLIFCSGQVPLEPGGDLVSGTIEEETERCLRNIEAVLAAAGTSFSGVVKTTIFLTSMDDFVAVNEVYGRYIETDPPARSTVAVAALPKGARVEIECIARG